MILLSTCLITKRCKFQIFKKSKSYNNNRFFNNKNKSRKLIKSSYKTNLKYLSKTSSPVILHKVVQMIYRNHNHQLILSNHNSRLSTKVTMYFSTANHKVNSNIKVQVNCNSHSLILRHQITQLLPLVQLNIISKK